MNTPLFTYLPTSNDQLYLWLGIAIGILAGISCYWLLTNPGNKQNRNYRIILALLSFFVAMMALGTAFFSGWNLQRQGKVELYADQLVIGQEEIPFTAIRNITMKRDRGSSLLGINDQQTATTFLLIERSDGRSFVLSDQHFPLNEIAGRLKELQKAAGQ